ncbi:MAG TPA: hypothetical protein PLP35_07020 [Caldisericia bacterium]|nr:hypothetical protein [Caldisericia bacterium]HRV75574.1 hypothetical protein [Caldisericia bacterium]
MKRKTLIAAILSVAIILTQASFFASRADTPGKVWKYRRTLTIEEQAGIDRLSYPVNFSLQMDDINDDNSDIRVTDAEGVIIPYQVVSKNPNAKLIVLRISVDLTAKGKHIYHVYYGNETANPQQQEHVGVERYLGTSFVTYAWGEVIISSYTKDNKIDIKDANGNLIRDANKRGSIYITPSTLGPGEVRRFKLEKPTVINIQSTGLSSVAVGNFSKGETDTTAFIPGVKGTLIYIPSFVAITSLDSGNKIDISYKGKVIKSIELGEDQTVVMDELEPEFRKIETRKDCLIQYGTGSALSQFTVPQRGLKYSFLPLGPVTIMSAFDGNKIDIKWSDGNGLDTFTLNAGEKKHLDVKNVLEPGKQVYDSMVITSKRPITVIASAYQDEKGKGYGAMYLPGSDGLLLSTNWNTVAGSLMLDAKKGRNLWLIQPFSETELKSEPNSNHFKSFVSKPLTAIPGTTNISNERIIFATTAECFLLDGNPEDVATLFQVPAAVDRTVKDPLLSNAQTNESGWMPEGGAVTEPEGDPDKIIPDGGDSGESFFGKVWGGISSFFSDMWESIKSPAQRPFMFALFVVFVLLLIVLVVWLYLTFFSKDDDDFLATDFSSEESLASVRKRKELIEHQFEAKPAKEERVPTAKPVETKKPDLPTATPEEQPIKTSSKETPKAQPTKLSTQKEETAAETPKPTQPKPLQPKPTSQKPQSAPEQVIKPSTKTGFRTPKLQPPDITKFMTKPTRVEPEQKPFTKEESKPQPKIEPIVVTPDTTNVDKMTDIQPPTPVVETTPQPQPEIQEIVETEDFMAKGDLFDGMSKNRGLFDEVLDEAPDTVEEGVVESIPETPHIEDTPVYETPIQRAPEPQPEHETKPTVQPQQPKKPEPRAAKAEQYIPERRVTPPPTRITHTFSKSVSGELEITESMKELASKMKMGGLVADPGAIVRLHHIGLLELFNRIYISHTATMLLPDELKNNPAFEKIMVMGKDARRAENLVTEYDIFEEAARAIVIAEKMKVKYYLTSSRLPEHLGKINVVHVERFS